MANEKKQIFILLSVDAWSSRDSERLLMVTLSPDNIKELIAKKIEDGEMEYDGGVDSFTTDWKIERRNTINSKLTYGRYDYAYDGEEI